MVMDLRLIPPLTEGQYQLLKQRTGPSIDLIHHLSHALYLVFGNLFHVIVVRFTPGYNWYAGLIKFLLFQDNFGGKIVVKITKVKEGLLDDIVEFCKLKFAVLSCCCQLVYLWIDELM